MKVLISWHAAVEPGYRKLFDELASNGLHLSVIAPRRWREGGRMLDFFSSNLSLYRTTILNIFFTNHMRAFFYPSIFKIVDEIKAFKPDIIYIMEEPFSLAAFELLTLKRLSGSKAKTILFSFENIDIPQRFPYSFFQKHNLKHSDAIVVVPDEAICLWRKRGFSGTISKIALGIDSKMFKKIDKDRARAVLGIKGDVKFKLGYVGRIVKEKGIETVIEAMNLLKKKGKSLSFYIAGSGNYKNDILASARENGLTDSLHIFDAMEQNSLVDFYNSIDALILPSITTPVWKEQFGRVLPEAMSCGIPVIGSSSGEIPSVIGEAGLVFKEKDHYDLAGKIEIIMENKNLRYGLIEKGIKKAADEYSWEAIAGEYAKLYSQLMAETAGHVK